jgi:hypothetical protein
MWTACFANHLYQLLYKHNHEPRYHEGLYHCLCLFVPSLAVAFFVIRTKQGGTNEIGLFDRPWCWISDTRIPFDPNDMIHWFLNDGMAQQLAFIYLPYAIIFVYNVTTYIALFVKVNGTSMGPIIQRRLLGYILALLLTGGFSAAHRLYQYMRFAFTSDSSVSPTLLYMESVALPLQGLVNAILYGVNAKILEGYKVRACGCLTNTKVSKSKSGKLADIIGNIDEDDNNLHKPLFSPNGNRSSNGTQYHSAFAYDPLDGYDVRDYADDQRVSPLTGGEEGV